MIKLRTLLTLGLVTLLTTVSLAQRVQATFLGSDNNWFNSRNWSTGQVPDSETDVVIDGQYNVVIEPSLGSAVVQIHDLILRRRATLETKPGTQFTTRNEFVGVGCQLIHRSTLANDSEDGGTLYSTSGGVWLNPTPKTKRIVVLTNVTLTVGLGGATPASPAALGAGTYANLSGESVLIEGKLKVVLYYGFRPQAGQSFTIVRASNRILGGYDGLHEGSMVARFGDIGLYLGYGRDEAGRIREHILLARQIPPIQ